MKTKTLLALAVSTVCAVSVVNAQEAMKPAAKSIEVKVQQLYTKLKRISRRLTWLPHPSKPKL